MKDIKHMEQQKPHARKEWQDILNVMNRKNLLPTSLYPARISFRFDREIKIFTDEQK